MSSKAHGVLLDLVAKLRAKLVAQSKAGHTGSFEDINCFLVFRKASGVERGMSIDVVAFMRALTVLGVAHTENTARTAFGILLSMDDSHALSECNTGLEFRHVSFAAPLYFLSLINLPPVYTLIRAPHHLIILPHNP